MVDRTPPATPEARLAERTKNNGASSPGHKEWDRDRGVQPRQPAKAIDTSLVARPGGDPHGARAVVAPHGVRVAGDREKAHQGGGPQKTRFEKR